MHARGRTGETTTEHTTARARCRSSTVGRMGIARGAYTSRSGHLPVPRSASPGWACSCSRRRRGPPALIVSLFRVPGSRPLLAGRKTGDSRNVVARREPRRSAVFGDCFASCRRTKFLLLPATDRAVRRRREMIVLFAVSPSSLRCHSEHLFRYCSARARASFLASRDVGRWLIREALARNQLPHCIGRYREPGTPA